MAYDALTGKYSDHQTFRGAALSLDATGGFFQGKQYRAWVEFTANTTIQFTASQPFMLQSQSLFCDAGAVRVAISTGSTPSGTFTAIADQPVAKNRLTGTPNIPHVSLTSGGTVTGGTVREVLRASAGTSNAGLPTAMQGVRALPAGTYSISITVTGTTSGLYSLEWEELDN